MSFKLSSLRGSFLLAIPTTTLSVVVSAAVGWERGVGVADKVLWAALGVVSVLVAHGLLATRQFAPKALRSIAAVLWVPCISLVLYSHASYFLLSQQKAGMTRAEAIGVAASMPLPNRSASAVLTEQGKVHEARARILLSACVQDCGALRARAIALDSKLRALDAELDEVRRWQAAQDRQDALKEVARADPVSVRLSSLFGLTDALVSMTSALLVFVVLDLVGCYGWCLVAYHRVTAQPSLVTEPVTAEVTESGAPVITEAGGLDDRALTAIRAGLKPTVENIRKHLKCSQERARKVRLALVTNGHIPG